MGLVELWVLAWRVYKQYLFSLDLINIGSGSLSGPETSQFSIVSVDMPNSRTCPNENPFKLISNSIMVCQ